MNKGKENKKTLKGPISEWKERKKKRRIKRKKMEERQSKLINRKNEWINGNKKNELVNEW